MVGAAAAAAHDLSQPRLPARACTIGTRSTRTDAPSTPTAASASRSRSIPGRPGIAACSTTWSTASEHVPAPARLHRPCARIAARRDRSRTGSSTVLKIRTSNEEFYRCYRQAIEDMAALRLPIAGTDHMVFLPAAGLPWFVALFGRDSLIVSLQNMLVYPEFARGALDVLGALAGDGARRLSRRRAGQDPARAALRRARAFQADPAHAVLRHRRRHAALPDHAARRLARHRRPRAARAAPGHRRGLPRLDRRLRRPRRRRVPGVPDALAGRLREHGLEGLRRLPWCIRTARW